MSIASTLSQVTSHPWVGVAALIVGTAVIAPTVSPRTVNESRITVLNGVAYNDNVPFTGRVVEKFANGDTRRSAQYRAGKLDGTSRAWYDNGEIEYVRSYSHGVEEGTHQGWYDNGHQRFEYHYHNGIADGVSRQWYPNGKPYTLAHYTNGQESGQQQMWDDEGKLRANYVIRDGRRFGLPGSIGCRGAQ